MENTIKTLDQSRGFEDAMDTLERLHREYVAFATGWRTRAVGVENECCTEHGFVLEMDVEKSIRQSFYDKRDAYVYKPCPACSESSFLAEEDTRLISQGVPKNLIRSSLMNWTPRSEDDAQILKEINRYSKTFNGAAFLFGKDFGVGKTHLAVALLRIFKRGMFITQAEFVSKLRDGYSDHKTKIVRDCIQAQFLIMDDVGIAQSGADVVPSMHEVFNERQGDKKPFIITANCSRLEEMEPILGERMFDRFKECLTVCRRLTGKSMRGTKKVCNE